MQAKNKKILGEIVSKVKDLNLAPNGELKIEWAKKTYACFKINKRRIHKGKTI